MPAENCAVSPVVSVHALFVLAGSVAVCKNSRILASRSDRAGFLGMHSRTLCSTLPSVHRPPRVLRSLCKPTKLSFRPRAQPQPSASSHDSEGDELLREFQQYSDPNRLQKVTKRLELTWSVDRRRRPAPCDCCDGTGQKECAWCRGTGAMMVGEERFCSLAHGCKQCPICKSKGHVGCGHCKGTGLRAGWMEPGCPA